MGRYLDQPLQVKCGTFYDIRRFLSTCRAMSDKEAFGKKEYWQPPEHFEQTRKGDCDDFALWTWRQLLSMGYNARFVAGRKGMHGHAWVTYERDGKHFIVEPMFWFLGDSFPRLSTVRYHPRFSVAWDGEKISFYAHKDLSKNLKLRQVPILLLDWLVAWTYFWTRHILHIPRFLFFRVRRFVTSLRNGEA
jgi:hypothetical protein